MDKKLYRELGKSGLMVAPLAMGCWAYGGGEYWGEQNQNDVNRVVSGALDRGINLFDTAEMYNNGASEESLGKALGARRSEAIICSKVGPDHAYADELAAHCEASLRRLKTDYLDMYMLHWPLNPRSLAHFTKDERKIATPPTIEEAMDALQKLKDSGKIRAIGVSNFGVRQLREAVATGVRIDVNEITYSILSRAIEKEILPCCQEHDISIVSSMTLQQGLLAGVFQSAEQVPAHQAHSRHFAQCRGGDSSRHGGEGYEELMFDTIRTLQDIAAEQNLTLAGMSIAWALQKPGVAAALVGSRDLPQLEENARALEIRLPQDVMDRIDRASQALLEAMGANADYYESAENCRIW